MRYGPTTRALAQWRCMTSTATGRRDARVGTFVWTPSTGVLRSCASLPSLLDLDADDDRPLLTRIVAHLHRDDIDRLHDVMRDVRSRGDAQSVDVDLTTRDGAVRRLRATATRVPEQEGDSVIGVVTDVTGMRHIEHALEVRQAVTAALAEWHVLGFDGLLGPLGSALAADAVTVWASRDAGLRALATWNPSDTPASESTANASDVVVTASRLGLAVVGCAGGVDPRPALNAGAGLREELAFPILTLKGVLAVVELRSASGLPISDTLTRVLESVGREVGAFFNVRACLPDDTGLSARELEVLELVAEGLSAAEIAARLVLSRETIRTHIRNVHAKLGVGDRVSAVVKAMRAGLIR
jgi:DNA-binding CsgD family transcriptional regulator